MKFLDSMKLGSKPCPLYLKAKSSTRKHHAQWLKRSAVEAYFQQHYDAFDQTVAAFNLPPTPSAKRRLDSLMQEFYLRPNAELQKLLQERRHDHGLTACPFCGNPLIPDTLDHFLPKEDWPEYAIFTNNLVPQCRACAPIKSRRYFCAIHQRAMFLHPMYSAALASVRFKINVSIRDGNPNFEIKFSAAKATAPIDVQRIEQHLRELKVLARMQEFCVRHWSHWRQKVKTLGIEIEALFRLEIGSRSTGEYSEDWATAFMKGVLRDSDALAALNAKPSLLPAAVEELIELNIR